MPFVRETTLIHSLKIDNDEEKRPTVGKKKKRGKKEWQVYAICSLFIVAL